MGRTGWAGLAVQTGTMNAAANWGGGCKITGPGRGEDGVGTLPQRGLGSGNQPWPWMDLYGDLDLEVHSLHAHSEVMETGRA